MMNRASKSKIKPPVRPSELSVHRDSFLHDVLNLPLDPTVAAPRNARDITGNQLPFVPTRIPPFAPIDPTASIAHHPLIVAASRFVRDAPGDSLQTFASDMQIISHIANGISLVSGLTKGTIRGNDLVAELLHMGSLKPDTLNSMQPGDLAKLVDVIEPLTTGFHKSTEVTKLEDTIQAMIKANVDFEEVRTLGKLTDYETALGTLLSTAVTANAVKGPNGTVTQIKTSFETVLPDTTPPATPMKVVVALSNIHANLGVLEQDVANYATVLDFVEKLKKLTEDSSFIQVLVNESNARKEIITGAADGAELDKVKQNFQLFGDTSTSLKAQQAVLDHLTSFVNSRESPKSVGITAGLPHGNEDLDALTVDTGKLWLQRRTKGSTAISQKLGAALRPLDGVSSKVKAVERVWEPEKTKIKSVQTISSLEADMIRQTSTATTRSEKLDQLFTCHNSNNLKIANIENIKKPVKSIQDLNDAVKKLSDFAYLADFKDLTEFKTASQFDNTKSQDEKEAAAPGMVNDLKQKNADALLTKLDKFMADMTALDTIVKNLPATVATIKTALDTIKAYHTRVKETNFEALVKCLNDNVGQEGRLAIDMIQSIRAIQELNAQDFTDAKAFVNVIQGSTTQLKAATKAANDIKQVTTPEVKSLDLFNKPEAAKNLGLAVQGITALWRAKEKKQQLSALTRDLTSITTAATKHQNDPSFSNHYRKIQDLTNLGNQLSTMYQQIDDLRTQFTLLKENDLENNGVVFEAANRIPSIVADVKGIKECLEALGQIPNLEPNTQSDLTAAIASLDVVDKLDLDFARFNMNTAKPALKELDMFFASWTQFVSATQAPPSPGTNNGGRSGGSGSNGQQVGGASAGLLATTEAGSSVGMIIGIVAGVVVLSGAIAGLLVWFLYFKKKKEEETEEELYKARVAARLAEEAAEQAEKKLVQKLADKDEVHLHDKAAVKKETEQAARLEQEKAREQERLEEERKYQERIPDMFHASDEFIEKLETRGMEKMHSPADFLKAELKLFKDMNEAERGTLLNREHVAEIRHSAMYRIDTTAVKLAPFPNTKEVPFIHANVLQMKDATWIMSQAPLDGKEKKGKKKNTQAEHWLMIDQKDVAVTLQLCNFVEEGSVKCSQYYPAKVDETMTCGPYTLKTLKINTDLPMFTEYKEHYSLVTVEFTANGKTKTHDILRFFGWGDHGAPDTETPVLEMIAFAESYKKTVLVHCSAGVGRTGTLVGVKKGIEMCETGQKPGLKTILTTMRECRYNAVQTEIQILYLILTITKGLMIKTKEVIFVKSYPAILYYYKNMKNGKYTEYALPARNEKKEPVDSGGNPVKTKSKALMDHKMEISKGEKKKKKIKGYEYFLPEDAIKDIEEQHKAVDAARKEWEKKHGKKAEGSGKDKKKKGDNSKTRGTSTEEKKSQKSKEGKEKSKE